MPDQTTVVRDDADSSPADKDQKKVVETKTTEFSPNSDDDNTDGVSIETHRKLLREKKRAAERARELEAKVSEYEAAEKERHEKSLQEQNKYQELLALREKELAEEREKTAETERRRLQARKVKAVLDKLPGSLPDAYLIHINADKVLVNPDTGEIDDSSVHHVCKEFLEHHHVLLGKPVSTAQVDPSAPVANSAGKLSAEDWKSLPSKERKEKISQVAGMEDWMRQGDGLKTSRSI